MSTTDASSAQSPSDQFAALAADIKLSHTVFALPFALLGMGLAAGWAQRWPAVGEVGLILGCMVLARTFAMTVNRWADAGFDALNPRTAARAVPSGRLDKTFVTSTIFLTAIGFVVVAAGFWLFYANLWPLLLSPAVLAVLAGYSYTKRFTWLCHAVLGFALALSPLAAALALEPGYLAASPTVWLIAAMVLAWVAGFDVLYALQDVAIDRELQLRSIPASLGEGRALWISRGLHLVCAAALLAAGGVSPQLHVWFFSASLLTIALLVLEHALVGRSGTRRIHLAFFTVNGIISLLLGLAGLVDVATA
jgi:4-hydroxybenzoate polyprenyltransferase